MPNILCADADPAVEAGLVRALDELGYRAVTAARAEEALRAARLEPFDLVLADAQLPDGGGLGLLRALREKGLDVPVVILTGYSSAEDAISAMRGGAADYLTKPVRLEALRLAVTNALEVVRLRRDNAEFRREIDEQKDVIVGAHPSVRAVLETIAAVAPTRAAILLEGESGTGKELFARAVHDRSPRADRPFVTVNCAALPEGLVESTLFGHERGAFSGASARFRGAFERAHQGTLLLDEVSELRLDLQAKLLRALQEQEFERLGGGAPVRVDVRIVATTNRDLAAEVVSGRFRRDLYYRLSVVPIRTPTLRERLEDLPLLVEHFARRSAFALGLRPPAVAPETIAHLRQRPWPGNVRELANAVERAVLLGRGRPLTPDLFPIESGAEPSRAAVSPRAEVAPLAVPAPPGPGRPPRLPLSAVQAAGQAVRGDGLGGLPRPVEAPTATAECYDLTELERDAIRRALRATNGNRTRAARLLGISDRTLRKKLNSGFLATD